jgi:hypothetical protein
MASGRRERERGAPPGARAARAGCQAWVPVWALRAVPAAAFVAAYKLDGTFVHRLHSHQVSDAPRSPTLYQHPLVELWVRLAPVAVLLGMLLFLGWQLDDRPAAGAPAAGRGAASKALARLSSARMTAWTAALAAADTAAVLLPGALLDADPGATGRGALLAALALNCGLNCVVVGLNYRLHTVHTNQWNREVVLWQRMEASSVFAAALPAGHGVMQALASAVHAAQHLAAPSTACGNEVAVVAGVVLAVCVVLVLLPAALDQDLAQAAAAGPAPAAAGRPRSSATLSESMWTQFCAVPLVLCLCSIDAMSSASPRMVAFCGLVAAGATVVSVGQSVGSFLDDDRTLLAELEALEATAAPAVRVATRAAAVAAAVGDARARPQAVFPWRAVHAKAG